LMPIYEKSGLRERPEIWVVMGVYNIAARIGEIIQTCQHELLIALPQVAEGIARTIQPTLRMLQEKGVKINVLASEETKPDTVRAISRVAEVRLKNNMFGGGVIGDSKHVMILLSEGRSENGDFEPTAIWAEHIGLAKFAKDYFHYLWADADSTGEKLRDINSNRKKDHN
jgi:HTH-type transcriptional regulator, sugar sensing transcriptional regulator